MLKNPFARAKKLSMPTKPGKSSENNKKNLGNGSHQDQSLLIEENNYLKGILATQNRPCIYCGLKDMSKCARGFPGCSRADDLFIGEEVFFKHIIGMSVWQFFVWRIKKLCMRPTILIICLPIMVGLVLFAAIKIIKSG